MLALADDHKVDVTREILDSSEEKENNPLSHELVDKQQCDVSCLVDSSCDLPLLTREDFTECRLHRVHTQRLS